MSSDEVITRAPRLPANYSTILEAIDGAEHGLHLTAQEVYVRTRERRPKIGFATVHRGLARLCELGLVVKVNVPGADSAVYEISDSPHAHFRCLTCGGIRDVEFSVPSELRAALAARYGVQIVHESMTFGGRCASCAATAPG